MYDKIRILVGFDDSKQAQNALMEAITIAKRFSGYLKVVTVQDKGKQKEAEKTMLDAEKILKQENMAFDSSIIIGSNPAETLMNLAKQDSIDLIVVGNRGLGRTISFLLGSVSRKVVSDAYCNVLVVKK